VVVVVMKLLHLLRSTIMAPRAQELEMLVVMVLTVLLLVVVVVWQEMVGMELQTLKLVEQVALEKISFP